MTTEIYWNLHKKLYSVRRDGIVQLHAQAFILSDVKLAVQPAGRQRVLDTGRKNVHAFVRGREVGVYEHYQTPEHWETGEFKLIGYNPWLHPTFYEVFTQQPVNRADYVTGHINHAGGPVLLALDPRWESK